MQRRTPRKIFSTLAAAAFVVGVIGFQGGCAKSPQGSSQGNVSRDAWAITQDRIWLGGEFWANPMEDWRVVEGAAECTSFGGNRSVHSLTHQLSNPSGSFQMSVRVSRIDNGRNTDGGAGFRIGVRSEIDEYRSNCLVQEGLDAGILNNNLTLGSQSAQLPPKTDFTDVELHLSGSPENGRMVLEIEARSVQTGNSLGKLSQSVSTDEVLGNVALVSNFAIPSEDEDGNPGPLSQSRYRFRNWTMSGDAFSVSPEQSFGPILWSMYSLSDSRSPEGFVMKMSALTGPMGAKDSQVVELQVQRDGEWKSLGEAKLDPDAWVATFRIPNWNEKATTPFKLVYRESHRDGTKTSHQWTGTIQANPVGRPLRMAALTCQKDYGFPYEPVARNVENLKPDLVFFSGDQLYEDHGGFGFIRKPADRAILNYLRKFYQFGWAFRDVMRNQPTICLPDDHDVLQGNLWGEGGAEMQNPDKDPGASVLGGYVEPVRVVNAVHRSTLGHHPDAYDPTPSKRGMNVYFGDMVYGNVGFAILADRQWKSGPERVNVEVGITGQDEDPLFINPAYDKPSLQLLGERQEAFLEQWANDWRGHSLKAVLSQTVFAGLATHQPTPDRYLKYDFDSSGWPASARNRAIEIMRPSMALHICGDTHLGSLSQYGVDAQRDSNWAYCTPAIAAGWPRWWQPDEAGIPHKNRPEHELPNTGEYLDSFGNKAYVYAVGNPEVGKSPNRYQHAHEKGSGFGFITFDTEKRTYLIEAFRFLTDATDGKPDNQFPGWPVTIHQKENRGENLIH